MTTRRQFIRGAVAVAVSAALPALEYDFSPVHRVYGTNSLVLPAEVARKMAEALARSMMQTREAVTANILNKAFGEASE